MQHLKLAVKVSKVVLSINQMEVPLKHGRGLLLHRSSLHKLVLKWILRWNREATQHFCSNIRRSWLPLKIATRYSRMSLPWQFRPNPCKCKWSRSLLWGNRVRYALVRLLPSRLRSTSLWPSRSASGSLEPLAITKNLSLWLKRHQRSL